MASAKVQQNGSKILLDLFVDDHHFRYIGLLRHHMSLEKDIATQTVSLMMQCGLAMLSIGGIFEGDNFNEFCWKLDMQLKFASLSGTD